jgi:hypothetical protein
MPRVRFTPASIILLIYAIIAFALIHDGDKSQYSDAQTYIERVNTCVEQGLFYPNRSNINDDYINAPGYVNLLIIIALLFGNNTALFSAINAISIIITAYLLYRIILSLSNRKYALIGMTAYLLYLTNLGFVLITLSEPLFVLLLISYIYFRINSITQNTPIKVGRSLSLSLLLYLLNYVKPFAIIILAAEVIILLSGRNRIALLNVVKLSISYVITTIVITSAISLNTGVYCPQSVSLGYNLVLGSSPIADGSYVNGTFDPGNYGYIENQEILPYSIKDAIWKRRALEWVVANPIDWLLLIPQKIFYTFSTDFFTMHKLVYTSESSIETRDFISNWLARFPLKWSYRDYILLLNQLIYFTIIVGFIASLLAGRLKIWRLKSFYFILVVLLYSGMIITILGGSRYHYPIIPLCIIISLSTLHEQYSKNNSKVPHL